MKLMTYPLVHTTLFISVLMLDETRLAISLNLLIFLTIREIYCRAKVLDVAPNFTEKDETQLLLSSTLYARLKNPKKI